MSEPIASCKLPSLAVSENFGYFLARVGQVEGVASGIGADPSEEIADLYAALRGMEHGERPPDEERYQRLLARLGQLQEEEVRRMDEYFEARRALPRGAGYAALRRAEELLAEHEDPSDPDDAGGRTH